MADRKIYTVYNGMSRPIADTDAGLINTMKIGTSGSNSSLTKAVLDTLISINGGSFFSGDITVTSGGVATIANNAIVDAKVSAISISKITGLQTALNNKIETSLIAAANGVASLGADGKIPSSQIPAMAITDTFVVASEAAMLALVAQTGDVAIRSDESKTYILQGSDPSVLGNWVMLQTPASPIQSVNGKVGVVVLNTDDVGEGSTNWYYTASRFNTSLASKTTDNLSEGSTNLYFTASRAKTAAVEDSIVPGHTDIAPSGHAVSVALGLKADDSVVVKTVNGQSPTAGAVTLTTTNISEGTNEYFTAARAKSAAVEDSINAGHTDIAPSGHAVSVALALKQDAGAAVTRTFIAGESMAANTLLPIRLAVSGETSGRAYKASDAAESSCYVIGLINSGVAINAGDSIVVTMLGEVASSVNFSASQDEGKPVFLNSAGITLTPPSADGTVVVRVGTVSAVGSGTSKVLVQGIQVIGVN